jgi:hypothetical protein
VKWVLTLDSQIDWNQVAADPVLIQPITNGHAARMRYSRFRSTILNHEPQKRTRAVEKGRVTKSTKKDKDSQQRKNSLVKSESGASLSSYAQLSPASMASPYMDDLRNDFSTTRFLTPCSDDMSGGLCINPASIRSARHSDPNMFSPSLDHRGPDYMNQAIQDHAGLDNLPLFSSAFEAAYDMTGYKPGSAEATQTAADVLNVHEPQQMHDFMNDWSERMEPAYRG